MPSGDGLYDVDHDVAAAADAAFSEAPPVLIVAMAGFMDAGSAVRLATDQLLTGLEHETLARFDLDQLYDYRARRPPMVFERDHWVSYEEPKLELHLVTDDGGTRFLLLAGPEPDVQWERFIASLLELSRRLSVRLVVTLNAIPMAVPHTRPTTVTAHGTNPALIAGHEPWVQTVQVPASAAALLEFRLGQQHRDAIGFAVHVPHYLSQSDYPDAAATLLEQVSAASGLLLPAEGLREAAGEARAEIEAQLARSSEAAAVVHALEQQYDAYVGAKGRTALLPDQANLPSAEELGAELERFLREQDGGRH